MLSYRHAFHAGNHADMLKHFVLYLTLDYFNRKDKPYWYIDTHSGAGLYDLRGNEAQKVGEYKQGIALLQQAATVECELLAIEIENRQAVAIMLRHIERAEAFGHAAKRPSGTHLPGVLADTFTLN